ncbi:FAD-dependent oxidoreductase [Desulfitobacterium sp. PCE1]|uniref:FAD-dependent oxidoreductase n=1 Tax=Desulfitobacterium sp. PCE1 TaxID=146907 RepID=UPI0003601A12|nr:FAD-dependent oxidoreductase [Desulfitobacterium sp. PCE1]
MKRNFSRRDFLKAAAAGVVSTGTLGILGGCSPSSNTTAPKGTYTPGTYTATAQGMGEVTVTMTFDENSITNVALDLANETAGIGQAAKDTLIAQILDGQSVQVDGVSGASVTSKAVMKAAADCITQAGGNAVVVSQGSSDSAGADWLGEAPEIADSEIIKTYDYEVIVIGAGTSGTFAACSAVEEGAKTVLLEKFGADFGGSGIRDTLAAIGSKQQIANKDNPDKFDVIRLMYQHSQGYGDQRLFKVWADHSGEAIDWYTDRMAKHDVKILHEVDNHTTGEKYEFYDVGHSIQWEGREYQSQFSMFLLLDDYKAKGLEVHYDTEMIKLLKDGSKVTGVIAKTGDKYVRYNSSKGVIVCTGGYSNNTGMLQALQPETLKMTGVNYSFPGSFGQGIKACLWAGGVMDETHAGMIFDRACVKPDATGPEDAGWFWMGSQPFLKVDLKDRRFTNESGSYDHILHTAFNLLPEHTYAMLWDAGYPEDIKRFESHGCSRLYPHANGTESVFPMEYIQNVMNPDLQKQGYIVQADTIEELAGKLNIPADNLKATVDRYNELFDKQKDEDFDKEPFRLSQLRTAPFYGTRQCGGYFIATMDGIKINTDMNAVDKDGNAIEGLYVAGDCSGGYFHGSYVNLLAGAAAGRSTTFGRLAGRNAARRLV